jgi:hypothetical protein
MSPVEDILARAKRLPAKQRRSLIAKLQATLAARQGAEAPTSKGSTRSRPAGLAAFLALAGKAHSRHAGVSGDKYAHLGDAYADKR